MSWQARMMAEQEADDYLMPLGDEARRELMEDLEEKAKQTCEWETTSEA